MMTGASIGSGQAAGYSAYLESRTVAPSRGDYYLSPAGEPTETPGVWHVLDETRERLGLEAGEAVRAEQLVRLMEGRHPGTGEFIRRAGADGRRAGGIDLTFSAPKSVSAVWAIGSEQQRAGVEVAHGRAVSRALEHLRGEVAVVREGAGGRVLSTAHDVLAAEFRHTTARGVAGGAAPDPQIHSHVVVTGVVRQDGQFAAVASRPLFRAARELGAFYRGALAEELGEQGYSIVAGTGRDGRYFEVAGISESAREALSGRSREVWLAAERFRARYGRAPERDELRNVKLENRQAKTPESRPELQATWDQRVATEQLDRGRVESLQAKVPGTVARTDDAAAGWRERVTGSLTAQGATFSERELRASILEQGVGQVSPERVSDHAQELIASGEVIELEGERMTTREIRRMEQTIQARVTEMAASTGASVAELARALAAGEVAERIGGTLSIEQQKAVEVIVGRERAAVLIGQAGAGKGVVIDTAARAEQHTGRHTYGVAVAGDTAERLGRESPALEGHTMTLDSMVAKARSGSLTLNESTTVYFDEAGMADTRRLDALSREVSRAGGKLVMIGDERQLPAIGAGGLFAELSEAAPTARLSEVRRTEDPEEQRAWADLRAGRAEDAMAHYQSRGQLHFTDTREQALERAVQQWADLTKTHDPRNVALMSDASNTEIDRMNARAQHLRAERGELGDQEVELPAVPYGLREGDRVAFTAQHHPHGERRVENGTRGEVTEVNPELQRVSIRTDTAREITVSGEDLENVRLSYAQHVYRQQGATVDRSVVVTGGWQTSQEGAYVQASRARHGTDWHVAREDLGTQGLDAERVTRLSETMRASRAQIPSILYRALTPTPPETISHTDQIGRDLERSTNSQLAREPAIHHEEGISQSL
ncbi:MAG: relaxase domain-containing protein [Solirubrobacterales bacterium]|nr:relaxase domain-containing protein [Solirubrobacterales bacterium]